MECMKKKAREWQVRLSEEIKERADGRFITLTFNNESYKKIKEEMKEEYELFTKGNEENVIAKRAVRLFLERWRKKYKKSVRHWFVTELGEKNDRLHLHGIIFTEKSEEEIKERWGYGNIWIGKFVNRKTINYITKYMTKLDEKHKEYKAIILTSAGIGSRYAKSEDAKKRKMGVREYMDREIRK